MSLKKVRTAGGEFVRDNSGLFHYHNLSNHHVDTAIKDAIKNRPGTSWFWFNETPAPIYPRDSIKSLRTRWEQYRSAYQNDRGGLLVGSGEFLSCFLNLARIR